MASLLFGVKALVPHIVTVPILPGFSPNEPRISDLDVAYWVPIDHSVHKLKDFMCHTEIERQSGSGHVIRYICWFISCDQVC